MTGCLKSSSTFRVTVIIQEIHALASVFWPNPRLDLTVRKRPNFILAICIKARRIERSDVFERPMAIASQIGWLLRWILIVFQLFGANFVIEFIGLIIITNGCPVLFSSNALTLSMHKLRCRLSFLCVGHRSYS